MKLLSKITFFVLATLILLLSMFSYFVIKDEKETLSSLLTQQGELLTKTVSAASVENLLIEDYPLLDSYLDNISTNYKSIDFIEIIKDKNIVSSIKNLTQVEKENIKIFNSDIKVDEDIIGKVRLGLSTTANDEIINKRIEQFLISIVLISVLLFIILLYIIKHYLLTYIERLKEHTKLLGDGKYHEVLDINTKDEFEELSHSINEMSKNILESHTNLKQLNILQSKQKKQLIEANKAKDEFLANMSHELKTPLNSINVISSVMMKNKDSLLNEKQVKNLSIINHCGNDLLYLINDVLDISKLEAGEITLNYQTFNLFELMQDIKNMIQPQAKDKNIKFLFDYDDSIQYIYSDKERIKQIVKNLLSNSLKFVKEGSIQLSISNFDDRFIITVKDNGIGIEEKKLEHIFDRFKQADASTTRKYGGTGLGLAISKELTDLLEGNIEVKSKVGSGTIFTLSFPKNLEKVNINTHISFNESSISKEIKKDKIILLNNDPISFMSFVIELKKMYEVVQVTSLDKLLLEIKNEDYSAIAVDVSNINQNNLKSSLDFMTNKLILISEDSDIIDESLNQTSVLNLTKPLGDENLHININLIKNIN